MDCPKCGAAFEPVVIREIEVDRCTVCRGIWFDDLEKYVLEKLPGTQVIDVGESRIGKQYNVKDRYPCPNCGNPMIRMVDPKQPHIWFEQCGSCHGTFFDAGEFKDLKEFTVTDIVKRWFVEERD